MNMCRLTHVNMNSLSSNIINIFKKNQPRKPPLITRPFRWNSKSLSCFSSSACRLKIEKFYLWKAIHEVLEIFVCVCFLIRNVFGLLIAQLSHSLVFYLPLPANRVPHRLPFFQTYLWFINDGEGEGTKRGRREAGTGTGFMAGMQHSSPPCCQVDVERSSSHGNLKDRWNGLIFSGTSLANWTCITFSTTIFLPSAAPNKHYLAWLTILICLGSKYTPWHTMTAGFAFCSVDGLLVCPAQP